MTNPYSRFEGCLGYLNHALGVLDGYEKYFKKVGDTDVGTGVVGVAREQISDLKNSFSELPNSTLGRMFIYLDDVLKNRLHLLKPLAYADRVLRKALPNQKDKIVSDVMAYLLYPEMIATETDMNMQLPAGNYYSVKHMEEDGSLDAWLRHERNPDSFPCFWM